MVGKTYASSPDYIFRACNPKEGSSLSPSIYVSNLRGEWDSQTLNGKRQDLAPLLLKTLHWSPNIYLHHKLKHCALNSMVLHTITFAHVPLSIVPSSPTCPPGKILYPLFKTYFRPNLPKEALAGVSRRSCCCPLLHLCPPLWFHYTHSSVPLRTLVVNFIVYMAISPTKP